MTVSLELSDTEVSAFADKVAEARNLYGVDSAYVIGMVNAFELLLGQAENADEIRTQLRRSVISRENGETDPAPKTPRTPERGDGNALAENTWIRGAVKWFNNDKGYGFISIEGNVDVFVHWRDISSWDRSIGQGEEVEFMVTKTAKGFQAVNVMKTAQKEKEEERESSSTEREAEALASESEGGATAVSDEQNVTNVETATNGETATDAPADDEESEESDRSEASEAVDPATDTETTTADVPDVLESPSSDEGHQRESSGNW